MGQDDELVEAMRAGEADDDLTGVVDDGRGDVEESEAEALPLPAHGLRREDELCEPGFDVVREAGAGQEGHVRAELAGEHANGGDAVAEQLYDVHMDPI